MPVIISTTEPLYLYISGNTGWLFVSYTETKSRVLLLNLPANLQIYLFIHYINAQCNTEKLWYFVLHYSLLKFFELALISG